MWDFSTSPPRPGWGVRPTQLMRWKTSQLWPKLASSQKRMIKRHLLYCLYLCKRWEILILPLMQARNWTDSPLILMQIVPQMSAACLSGECLTAFFHHIHSKSYGLFFWRLLIRLTNNLLLEILYFVAYQENDGGDPFDIEMASSNRERPKLLREQFILKQVWFSIWEILAKNMINLI